MPCPELAWKKWLQAQSPETSVNVQEIIHEEDMFINIIMDYREKLVSLYATGKSENDMTEDKAQILNSLKLTPTIDYARLEFKIQISNMAG